jgi:choice-of-anchor A domain-containing protein
VAVAPYAVVSGGNFTGSNGSLNNGVSAAGTITLNSFSVSGPQRPNTPPPFSFTDEFRRLTLLSATWADLQANGSSVLSGDQLRLTFPDPSDPAPPANPRQVVFEVDAADLSRARLLYINVSADLPVLVNVTGTTRVTIGLDDMVPSGVTASKLMWNFARLAQLDFRHGVPGTARSSRRARPSPPPTGRSSMGRSSPGRLRRCLRRTRRRRPGRLRI